MLVFKLGTQIQLLSTFISPTLNMEIMTIYFDICQTGAKTHFCNNTHFPVDT